MASSSGSHTSPSEERDQASMQHTAQDAEKKAPNSDPATTATTDEDREEESPEPEWKSSYKGGKGKQPKHVYKIGATVYVLSGVRGQKGPYTVCAHNSDGTYNLNNGPEGDRTRNGVAERDLD